MAGIPGCSLASAGLVCREVLPRRRVPSRRRGPVRSRRRVRPARTAACESVSARDRGTGGADPRPIGSCLVLLRRRLSAKPRSPVSLSSLNCSCVCYPIAAVSQYAVVATGLAFKKAGFTAVEAEAERRTLCSQRRLFFALRLVVCFIADPLSCWARFLGILLSGCAVGQPLARMDGRLWSGCGRSRSVIATTGLFAVVPTSGFALRMIRSSCLLIGQRDGDLENSFGIR